MPLPNFLLIGAPRSGTTSLYHYLKQHPQIYVSSIKGPCFFAFEEGERPKFNGPGDQDYYDRNVITSLGKYLALFEGVTDQKAIGEGSVLYLQDSFAPIRIKRYIPDVKMIALLRNPVDRAFSNHSILLFSGREPVNEFEKALELEEQRIMANWAPMWGYKRLGFYSTQLSRYYELFPPEQIAIYTYDEFRKDTIATVQNIFDFLGVDRAFVPDTSVRHITSTKPKWKGLAVFLSRPSKLKSSLKLLLPTFLHQSLRTIATQWNTDSSQKPEIQPETRRMLMESYQDEIFKLQDLIQRDLSIWLKV